MRTKNFIISITLASMVYQPIALAQQNQIGAGQSLKEFVKANQPNGKANTYKKFWDQNKKGMSSYWQKVFTPSMEMQKNDLLPKMEVIDIKGPRGTSAERMMMNIDGKTVSVEFLGGKDKFARVNNTVITYADFYYVTGMIEKLSKDPVFAGETKKLQQEVLAKSTTTSYEQYKKMTVTERGQLLLMTRLAAEAASNVLMLAAEAEGKKTAANFFWDVLLPQAHAASVVGLPCLVGGYEGKITRSGNRTFCDPSSGIASFNNDPKNKKLVQTSGCSGNSFGCHPVNFPASTGICFSKSNRKAMQTMTKQCGDKSPYKTPQDQAKLVEAYQKRLGVSTDVKLNEQGKVIDEKTFNEAVKPYMNQFNDLNRSAYANVCSAANRTQIANMVDPEIDSACDTLEQRKIALELFVAAPPAADSTPAPIAGREECTAEGGKPGFKDEAGKCIPFAVARPAGDPCAPRGLEENPAVGRIPTHVNGEKDCTVPAATERIQTTPTPPADASRAGGSFFSSNVGRFVIGGGIILLIAALFNKWTKSGIKIAPVIPATDPAAPPVPIAPPQPTNPAAPDEIGTGTSPAAVGTGSQR